jgi:hypothetical protein
MNKSDEHYFKHEIRNMCKDAALSAKIAQEAFNEINILIYNIRDELRDKLKSAQNARDEARIARDEARIARDEARIARDEAKSILKEIKEEIKTNKRTRSLDVNLDDKSIIDKMYL